MTRYLFLSLFVLLSLSCSKEGTYRIAKIPEASGIDYCTNTDTLVVANDEGRYYEIDRDGKILSKQKLGKFDLEGVICDDNQLIFVIEDRGLLLVNRKNGKKREVPLSATYHEKKLPLFEKKNGAEGIAKADGYFYIAKQAKKKNDSFIAVLQYDRYHRKIVEIIKPSIPDIAGLSWHNGYLYMVSDKKNTLIQYDPKKKKIVHKSKLSKAAQEGVAFDGKGFVYIADDKGHILKFSEKELGLQNYTEDKTPTPQSSIIHALQQWIEGWSDTDVTLAVSYLSHQDGWAWIEAAVRYADGKKHDPRIAALLKKKNGQWEIRYASRDAERFKSNERPQKDKSLQRFLKPPYGNAPLEIFNHNELKETK